MARVMRAFLLCCAVLGLLTACGSSGKQWYKPNTEYTIAEFQRFVFAGAGAGWNSRAVSVPWITRVALSEPQWS